MTAYRHQLILALLLLSTLCLWADESLQINTGIDELKIKREEVFEFNTKPSVDMQGDRVEISFETKSFCDTTIVIENSEGKIVRHLASGVLGTNAPLPFQKNSKAQKIVWDGKNDQGDYIDNKERYSVRVSLGLKPQFEKNVLWSPYQRIGSKTPILTACDEGVLVFDGKGVDHLRLFDHDGKYKRTIYPFPADKLNKVNGLNLHEFPQSKQKLPLKNGHVQGTLLTSGYSSSGGDIFGTGRAAAAMASLGNQIVISESRLNWLGLDGSTNGKSLQGPSVTLTAELGTIHEFRGGSYEIGPRSMAFSPDGKWLYMTSFFWGFSWHQGTFHGVARMATDSNEPPKLWKGSLKQTIRRGDNWKRETGEAPADFNQPMSVTCDSQGNVYIADYFNDRIQVFKQNGDFIRSIPSLKPTKVCVDPKSGEIYVFSWTVSGIDWLEANKINPKGAEVDATLSHYNSIANPTLKTKYPLPLFWRSGENSYAPYKNEKGGTWHMPDGWWYAAEIDFKASEPTIWLIPAHPWRQKYDLAAIKLYTMKEGKLVLKYDTGESLKEKIPLMNPAPFSRQRMCVDHKTGNLYVLEQDNGTDKNFSRATEYNIQTGKAKLVELPCHAEDMCFDINGLAYLRVDPGIIRFDSATWKEIPWDYGEENPGVMFSGTSGGRSKPSDSVLRVPGGRTSPFWHLGGIFVSAKGHLAVSTFNGSGKSERKDNAEVKLSGQQKPYTPELYPGRFQWGEIHIFDKHGKVVSKDSFPGIGHLDGVGIDKDDSIYVMVGATRVINGKKYDSPKDDVTETLIKVPANEAKVISTGNVPVPLPKSSFPNRSPDLRGSIGVGGDAWVENADWFYGGVGSSYINQPAPSCCCWNSRFTLDLLGRSFAPEVRHSSVAVLDTAGNLILRVGRYGNADDGKPLELDPENKTPRSIGGDEVGLFYAPFVASHTDKRLFIADPGNGRIISVKLNYHKEEKITLQEVPSKK